MLRKPWDEMTDREKENYYNSCSKCGGEKDSEGWCANYCTNDEDYVLMPDGSSVLVEELNRELEGA